MIAVLNAGELGLCASFPVGRAFIIGYEATVTEHVQVLLSNNSCS